MIKYIKENKTKIMATTTKVVAAFIIPGGLFIWGAYELGKLQQRKKDDKDSVQQDSQNAGESN